MKTHPPTDYDKTHRDDVALRLSDSRMGEHKQQTYFAWVVVFCFAVGVIIWKGLELWEMLNK